MNDVELDTHWRRKLSFELTESQAIEVAAYITQQVEKYIAQEKANLQAALEAEDWKKIDFHHSRTATSARLAELRALKNLKVSHNDPVSVVVAYAAYMTNRENELVGALKKLSEAAVFNKGDK